MSRNAPTRSSNAAPGTGSVSTTAVLAGARSVATDASAVSHSSSGSSTPASGVRSSAASHARPGEVGPPAEQVVEVDRDADAFAEPGDVEDRAEQVLSRASPCQPQEEGDDRGAGLGLGHR